MLPTSGKCFQPTGLKAAVCSFWWDSFPASGNRRDSKVWVTSAQASLLQAGLSLSGTCKLEAASGTWKTSSHHHAATPQLWGCGGGLLPLSPALLVYKQGWICGSLWDRVAGITSSQPQSEAPVLLRTAVKAGVWFRGTAWHVQGPHFSLPQRNKNIDQQSC